MLLLGMCPAAKVILRGGLPLFIWASILVCTAAGGAAVEDATVDHGYTGSHNDGPGKPVDAYVPRALPLLLDKHTGNGKTPFLQSIMPELTHNFGRQHVTFHSSWWDARRRSADAELSASLLDLEAQNNYLVGGEQAIAYSPRHSLKSDATSNTTDASAAVLPLPPLPAPSMDALRAYLAEGVGNRTNRPTSAVLRHVEKYNAGSVGQSKRGPNLLSQIANELGNVLQRPGVSVNAYVSANRSSALTAHTDRYEYYIRAVCGRVPSSNRLSAVTPELHK